MLKTVLDTIFNGLLIGTSGYVMYAIDPLEHPFAYAASVVGVLHGCTGAYLAISEGSTTNEGKHVENLQNLITSCLEIVSVPLINIELYRSSQASNTLALGHGLFIIPLAFEFSYKLCANEDDYDEATEILKDLTILGNIVSLLFLAANENNMPGAIMAFSAFFAYHGSIMLENGLQGTGKNASLAGSSLFFGLLPQAISKSGLKGI